MYKSSDKSIFFDSDTFCSFEPDIAISKDSLEEMMNSINDWNIIIDDCIRHLNQTNLTSFDEKRYKRDLSHARKNQQHCKIVYREIKKKLYSLHKETITS